MTQHVYITNRRPKEPTCNRKWEYEGDFPPFKMYATTGAEMLRAMTTAWRENKHAKNFVFQGQGHRATIKAIEIPLVLSESLNRINLCKDAWSWMQGNPLISYEHKTPE